MKGNSKRYENIYHRSSMTKANDQVESVKDGRRVNEAVATRRNRICNEPLMRLILQTHAKSLKNLNGFT